MLILKDAQPAVATDRSTGLLHAMPFVGSPMFLPSSVSVIARSVARGVRRVIGDAMRLRLLLALLLLFALSCAEKARLAAICPQGSIIGMPVSTEWVRKQLTKEDIQKPALYRSVLPELVKPRIAEILASLKPGDTIWYYKAPSSYKPPPTLSNLAGYVVIRECTVVAHVRTQFSITFDTPKE